MLLVFLFYGLLSIAPWAARAETNQGSYFGLRPEVAEELGAPIESFNQQPLELIHRTFYPTTAAVLPPGVMRFSLDGNWANTVNRRKGTFLFDAETRQLRPSLSVGIAEDFELSIDQPLLWRGAGFTDRAIDNWHRMFGMPRGPRQFVPDDEFVLEGDTRDGGKFVETRRGTGLTDGQLSGKYRLYHSAEVTLTTQLSVGLPTGRSGFSASGADLGAAMLASYRPSSFWFYSGFGFNYLTDPWFGALQFRRQQFRGFIGSSYFFSERFSAYLGLNAGGAFLENIERFPDYQIYLDVGAKFRATDSTFISFLMRENPAPSRSTTDVAFQLGISQLF